MFITALAGNVNGALCAIDLAPLSSLPSLWIAVATTPGVPLIFMDDTYYSNDHNGPCVGFAKQKPVRPKETAVDSQLGIDNVEKKTVKYGSCVATCRGVV